MRNNALKTLVRRTLFPNGAVRTIAFGPLRGMRYRVSPITGMETWHSGHERPIQNAFERLLKRGDCVVDVGTNWGGHALHLSRLVGGSGRVLAVEPSPGVVNCDREPQMLLLMLVSANKNNQGGKSSTTLITERRPAL